MPSGFVNGRSTIGAVYDGDPPSQIAAIWDYLERRRQGRHPRRADRRHDRAQARNDADHLSQLHRRPFAARYRRRLPEKAPIWLGTPTNSAWRLVWHGRFIDASKHWVGRGNGYQTPLGDDILKLEQTVPLAALDSLDAAWPASRPKSAATASAATGSTSKAGRRFYTPARASRRRSSAPCAAARWSASSGG